jgi:hypothetical protein
MVKGKSRVLEYEMLNLRLAVHLSHYESQRLATDWKVQGSNAIGDENFRDRPDYPRGHPACRTMGTVQYRGVKRPERGADHPPTSSTDVANAVELHIRQSSMPVEACHGLTFTCKSQLTRVLLVKRVANNF